MNADHVLKDNCLSAITDVRPWLSSDRIRNNNPVGGITDHIVYLPQAIAPEREFIRHCPHPIFATDPINEIGKGGETGAENETHLSNANLRGWGCSGAAYGTTISARERR